jgi:hypothetical protein
VTTASDYGATSQCTGATTSVRSFSNDVCNTTDPTSAVAFFYTGTSSPTVAPSATPSPSAAPTVVDILNGVNYTAGWTYSKYYASSTAVSTTCAGTSYFVQGRYFGSCFQVNETDYYSLYLSRK